MEVAKAALYHRVDNGAKKANQSEYDSENGKLCDDEAFFWGRNARKNRAV